MDYEKKYKAALNWMKDVYPTLEGAVKEDANHYFPELKESKDERIRKAIHIYLDWLDGRKDYAPKGEYSIKDMIAWLEKQGQVPVSLNIDKMVEDYANNKECDNEGFGKPVNCMIRAYRQDLTDAIATLKTDFAPKVEPKFEFKVGQWIVATWECVYLIAKIDDYNVTLIDTNGDESVFGRSSLDDAHLWTILEARDGDVLHSPSHHLIWIYKDNEHYHACVNMNYVTENVATDGLISIPNDACPATKDEQTILFTKIKEAGYEWDAEKKELKKIEQKPNETEKWRPQEESCICQLESLVKKQWRQAEKVHNSVNIKKMLELMFFLKTLNPM